MNMEASTSGEGWAAVESAPRVRWLEPMVVCPPAMRQSVRQYLLIALLAVACYGFFARFVLQTVEIVGSSMAPTLLDTGHYFVNRFVYLIRPPQAADIVVIRDPRDNTYAVKRIIAASGDSIYLKNGRVYVNGRALEEPYLSPGTATYAAPMVREQWAVCGPDRYFVLGDNRHNSADSRLYGPISRQHIVGMVMR